MNKPSDNMRKPVIMQVVPALETGGVERGTVDIAAAVMARGGQAIVVSSGGALTRELNRCGAIHITLPTHSKNPFVIWANGEKLKQLIREYKVDLVHTRSRAPAWSAYRAAKETGTPFVTTFHATYNFSNPLKKYYNSVMTKGDRVIAISDFIRRHMMEEYGTDWSRIRTIHRGVNIDLFNPEAIPASRVVKMATDWRLPDDVPVVTLSGRLTKWKGQLLLLEAIAKLDQPVHCLLIGSDQGREAYRASVEALAKKLGIDDRVHLVGECRDMPAAYKLSDVVVSASTDPEGFGRVAVEGQALGRLVLAPSHGAAVEQINQGVNGWLFKPGDADDLARKLKEALSLDKNARQDFYDRAISNVRERFTKELMNRKTLALYDELLESQNEA